MRRRLVPSLGLIVVLLLSSASIQGSALAQEWLDPTPPPTSEERGFGGDANFGGDLGTAAEEIDRFWSEAFAEAGVPYRPPTDIVALDQRLTTGCGEASPFISQFFYCPADETIYLVPEALEAVTGEHGDYGAVTILAHEWGHHVQWLLGVPPDASNALELQADCLAGAWTSRARELGLLDPGDVTEAAMLSAEYGDDYGAPQDVPNAHGIDDDRISAFMRGYDDGLGDCDLPFVAGGQQEPPSGAVPRPSPASALPDPPQPLPALSVPALLPDALSLPQGQPLRLYDAGSTTLADLAASLPDPAEADQRLRSFGWQESAYRVFAADGPPPDAAGWVELHVHRFAIVDGAAEALPYLAGGREKTAGLRPIDLGLFGDQATALAGPAFNGDEVSIYARRGSLVVRVTAIAPNGDPTADAIEAIQVPLRQLVDEPRVASPELLAMLPPPEYLPPGLRKAEEHARSASFLASGFQDPAEAEGLFQKWGWRESAAGVYLADGAGTAAGTTRLEVVVYRLADPGAAAEALPYFLDARAAALGLAEVAAPAAGDEARAIAGAIDGGREATVYFRVGPALFRATVIGHGNPMADLEALLG